MDDTSPSEGSNETPPSGGEDDLESPEGGHSVDDRITDPRDTVTDSSALRAVGAAVGLGILGMFILAFVSIVSALVGTEFGLSLTTLLVGGTALGQIVGFGGLGLWYLRNRGYSWGGVREYLGIRLPTLRELGVMVLGYVAIIVLLVVVANALMLLGPEPAENQGAATASENPHIIPAMILMMLFVVGPCEELLYRGVVQNRLREALSPAPAIAIASAIFASVHVIALAGDLIGVITTITILIFPSLVFGYVYEYTGNLVVPALLHGLHNSILLSILWVLATYGEELEELFISSGLLL